MIFFTSDNHFYHENIIGLCKRPFLNVEEMNQEMISRWNDMIDPEDTVYHLGDFTLGGIKEAVATLCELQGTIYFLTNPWHHDKRWLSLLDSNVLNKFFPLPPIHVIEVNIPGHKHKKPIVLCHYPLAEWDRKHYNSWHLHGHSHGMYQGEGLIMDVGVDCHNFNPVSLFKVLNIMLEREDRQCA